MEEETILSRRLSTYNYRSDNSSNFAENFWDEKISGYEVLQLNLKNLQGTVKELELYLRESANNEDTYVKQLNKTTAQMLKFSSDTSFSPIWSNVVKELNEHNSWAHFHFMHGIHELVKEVQSYYNDLRNRKRKVRQNEAKTSQLVDSFKQIKQQLNKSKEQYHQICAELEKQKQTLENNLQQNTPNAAMSVNLNNIISKLEKKCQSSMEEYTQTIEKYNTCKVEFEKRFIDSCSLFQMHEETHLSQMRTFLFSYTQLIGQLNSARQKNFNQCQHKLNDVYTVDVLLQQFITAKGTGHDRPIEAEFIEYQNNGIYSSSYDVQSPGMFNKRRSLTSPVNEGLVNSNLVLGNTPPQTTNSNMKEIKKMTDNKGFSSIFNIRNRKAKTKNANEIKSLNGEELSNPLSFSPNTLKQPHADTDIFSKTADAQLLHTSDIENENNLQVNKNHNNNNNQNDLSAYQTKTTNKNRLNSLPTLDTNANMTGSDGFPSSFDEKNFEYYSKNDLSIKPNVEFIDENLDNDPDYFPAFNEKNTSNIKDNEDMTNFYDSSGSYEEENHKKNLNKSPLVSNFGASDESDSDSDSTDSNDSDAQKKIFVKINPLNDRSHLVTSPDILNQISKNLKINSKLNNIKTTAPNIIDDRRNQSFTPSPKFDMANHTFDENNNEVIEYTQKPSTYTTTAQTISVSVFESPISPSPSTSSNVTPPPLPPLPLGLQQKAKERQRHFQQELKERVQKSAPILINTNGNSSIKIVKKNVEIIYDSTKKSSSIETSDSLERTDSETTISSNKIHLNIRIPADDEMQF